MSTVAGVPSSYIETRDLLIKAEESIQLCAQKISERSVSENLDRIGEISTYVKALMDSPYIYGPNADGGLYQRFSVVFNQKDGLYAHAGLLMMTSLKHLELPIDILPYILSWKGSVPFPKARIVCIADENHNDSNHQHNIWMCLMECLKKGDALYREAYERNKPVPGEYSPLPDDLEKSITHVGWDDMEFYDIYKRLKKEADDKWNTFCAVAEKLKQTDFRSE